MSPLLQVAEIAIPPLSLGLSSQNQNSFQEHEISLGQLIYKKPVAVVPGSFGKIYVTH